ncbi:MAG: hypothetical protein ACRDGD_07290 [Candidatus Limnocylindria bacterium]
MSQDVEDLWEAYHVTYRLLSPWVHAAGRSFANDALEQRTTGEHLVQGFSFSKPQMRSLVLPIILLCLASVSRQVGWGWEEECDQLRINLTTWNIDPSVE